ncbi:MAG: ABC transporter ATP-binding protein/permease [Clostridiales bacterium]|nr:ABC transporter ATP-binding protein/permease [Clostridiales bacterium]
MVSRNSQKSNASLIREFARYYQPHLRVFALDLFCALMIALIDVLFPVVTRRMLYVYIPEGAARTLALVSFAMLLVFALRALCQWIVTFLGHSMGVSIEADMRRDLFAHMETLDFSFFDRNRTGQLMSRITSDLFDVTELAHHGPEDLFISVITLAGAFLVLSRIQLSLALVLVAVVPLILLFIISRRRAMMRASRAVKAKIAGINEQIESAISGIRVSKAFGTEQEEAERFAQRTGEYVTARRGYYRAMADFMSGTEFMLNLMSLSVVCVGSFLILRARMDIATLVTFNMYVASIQSPIRRLTNFTELFTQGMAGFQRFSEIMHEEPTIRDAEDAEPLREIRGEIEFRDVSFSYREGQERVLSHISLRVSPGQMLALAGPSGGGKTTLSRLIPRFYEVQEGQILLDGRDIRKILLSDLRAAIGIVEQDVFLFPGTVAENILYGRPNATRAEVEEAAQLAEIADDIALMPQGYDTPVGERGVLLSGGQKQRIAIARIFLRNPPILILDEATSALDTVTERRIQRSLARLSEGRTTLVIAHRLSTIRHADEILVLDDHGVAERGTHDQLLAAGGLYAGMAGSD